jgi:hypothetical protein
MNLRLLTIVTFFATAPFVAFAQPCDQADFGRCAKGRADDQQHKAKLQAYCEMGKLEDQMAKAEEANDTKAVGALLAKSDALAQQIGPECPEYLMIVEGLEEVDPSSA